MLLQQEECGQRGGDDEHARRQVDRGGAEPECVEVDAGAVLGLDPLLGDGRALEDADEEGGPVRGDDDEGGGVEGDAGPADEGAVGALEDAEVDEAEGEFGEEGGYFEEDLVEVEELVMGKADVLSESKAI